MTARNAQREEQRSTSKSYAIKHPEVKAGFAAKFLFLRSTVHPMPYDQTFIVTCVHVYLLGSLRSK